MPVHIEVDEKEDEKEKRKISQMLQKNKGLTIMPCTLGTPLALSAGDMKLPLLSEM